MWFMMEVEPRKAGMVRLDASVRDEVDRYAASLGISYNAAMNILVREGLSGTRRAVLDPTTQKGNQ